MIDCLRSDSFPPSYTFLRNRVFIELIAKWWCFHSNSQHQTKRFQDFETINNDNFVINETTKRQYRRKMEIFERNRREKNGSCKEQEQSSWIMPFPQSFCLCLRWNQHRVSVQFRLCRNDGIVWSIQIRSSCNGWPGPRPAPTILSSLWKRHFWCGRFLFCNVVATRFPISTSSSPSHSHGRRWMLPSVCGKGKCRANDPGLDGFFCRTLVPLVEDNLHLP